MCIYIYMYRSPSRSRSTATCRRNNDINTLQLASKTQQQTWHIKWNIRIITHMQQTRNDTVRPLEGGLGHHGQDAWHQDARLFGGKGGREGRGELSFEAMIRESRYACLSCTSYRDTSSQNRGPSETRRPLCLEKSEAASCGCTSPSHVFRQRCKATMSIILCLKKKEHEPKQLHN